MALTLGRLPRYLVLDPVSTVRLEVLLARPSCEIDVGLENPRPGRSFLLLVGPVGGPVIQRIRLTGKARLLFEPSDERSHVLMLANPQKEPLVLRLRGRTVSRGHPVPPRDNARSLESAPASRGHGRRPRAKLVTIASSGPHGSEDAGTVDEPERRGRAKD
ncbi:MAG TPA: hypothetical protein VEH10_04840 [Thermoplasmata archaeon]|nr:hypothetical protein [Thermoplasmata archaeon]